MIISDHHKFVFVHIPKCAGTAVRSRLERFDDTDGSYARRVDQHPELGDLDYVHIPLFTLRDHFDAAFEKIIKYWSFAVVRDPFARLPSSISQRFRMYGDAPIQKQKLRRIKDELSNCINFLAKQPRKNHRLSPEYIHFQKQVDYVLLNGKPVVTNVYPLEDLKQLFYDLSSKTDCKIQGDDREPGTPRANRTVVHRTETIRRLVEYTRPATTILTKALPESTREKIRAMVYVPRDRRLQSLFESAEIKDFIRDYYREDIALWTEAIQSGPRWDANCG